MSESKPNITLILVALASVLFLLTIILSIAKLDQVLCFAKTPEGATDIVRGIDHPGLKHWKGEVDLGTLFASGVLGETPVHAD